MKCQINTEKIEIDDKVLGILIVNFGKSLYVWVGDCFLEMECLTASLPFNNIKFNSLDESATTLLFGENELCSSISSHICNLINMPILLSINIKHSKLNICQINKLQLLIKEKIKEARGIKV